MRRGLAFLALSLTASCASVTVGEIGPATTAAYLSADPRFNAGLPVVVALRKVDTTELGPVYSRAKLSPGEHHLIVDCTVAATQSTERFALLLDALPGAHYHLIADLAPGNQHCDRVRIEPR